MQVSIQNVKPGEC